jgi:AcrR family transcriptional regulator
VQPEDVGIEAHTPPRRIDTATRAAVPQGPEVHVPDLRRRLLDASATLIATDGLGALSMREVSRRAGVSHQAPYHHFPDREAVLAALAEEGFGALADAMDEAGRDRTDPRDRLTTACVAYVRWALEHPAHYAVMFRPELVDLDRFATLQAQGARVWDCLVDRIIGGVQAGWVGMGEAEVITMWVWSSLHGAVQLVIDGPLPPAGSRLDATSALEAIALRTARATWC